MRTLLASRRHEPQRYEVATAAGLEFLVRPGSVDRENLDWMLGSIFVDTLRQTALSSDDTVLDLGCHVGAFALIAAREKGCRVIGFEPDGDSARLAKANAALNGLEGRFAVHPIAVGGSDGEVILHQATENWGHTTIADSRSHNILTGHRTVVRQLSLESALALVPSGRCALLKFNTEGAEFGMMEAAAPATLARVHAWVGELHYDLAGGASTDIDAKLRACGFKVELFPDGDLRAFLRATRS